jgi:hypothetical protein
LRLTLRGPEYEHADREEEEAAANGEDAGDADVIHIHLGIFSNGESIV